MLRPRTLCRGAVSCGWGLWRRRPCVGRGRCAGRAAAVPVPAPQAAAEKREKEVYEQITRRTTEIEALQRQVACSFAGVWGGGRPVDRPPLVGVLPGGHCMAQAMMGGLGNAVPWSTEVSGRCLRALFLSARRWCGLGVGGGPLGGGGGGAGMHWKGGEVPPPSDADARSSTDACLS